MSVAAEIVQVDVMTMLARLQLADAKADRSFIAARKAERFYGAQLRRIAQTIGDLVGGVAPDSVAEGEAISDRLRRYAELITPWAHSVAQRMVLDVARRDRQAWRARSAEMGRLLRAEIDTAPTGAALREIMASQVTLIKSLPLEAAERVHKLTLEKITESTRASEIAAEILRQEEVSRSKAMLIARTEVSRTAATLQQVRAEAVGSTQYIWRTVGDSDVRPSHRRLNGKVFEWANPPECDPGYRANPGCIFNCRCFADPLIPEF